jgi:hypothetical protein
MERMEIVMAIVIEMVRWFMYVKNTQQNSNVISPHSGGVVSGE